jgi:hypothetical protein
MFKLLIYIYVLSFEPTYSVLCGLGAKFSRNKGEREKRWQPISHFYSTRKNLSSHHYRSIYIFGCQFTKKTEKKFRLLKNFDTFSNLRRKEIRFTFFDLHFLSPSPYPSLRINLFRKVLLEANHVWCAATANLISACSDGCDISTLSWKPWNQLLSFCISISI